MSGDPTGSQTKMDPLFFARAIAQTLQNKGFAKRHRGMKMKTTNTTTQITTPAARRRRSRHYTLASQIHRNEQCAVRYLLKPKWSADPKSMPKLERWLRCIGHIRRVAELTNETKKEVAVRIGLDPAVLDPHAPKKRDLSTFVEPWA